jgi:hypothetical protein
VNPQTVQTIQDVLLLKPLLAAASFAWGSEDTVGWMAAKRTFLILPLAALAVSYWATLLGTVTALFRSDRQHFMSSLLVTWWDLGRAVFSFWGGVFKAVSALAVGIFGLARLAVVGTWVALGDIVLIPFRGAAQVASGIANPSVPWIAVSMTLAWCIFEGLIFTYVMSPLVVDTLSNLTGDQLNDTMVRLPLFGFMLFIGLGSYSVLSTWTAALKSKDIGAILKIGAIELVALFVEVVFLYREFVDALVPWFAQHTSGNFELGIFGTLAIASATWFGIRSLSWFLFASSGTPTIMAIIQGTGLNTRKSDGAKVFRLSFPMSSGLVDRLQKESVWVRETGEMVLGAFILPPLQVVAAAINFCTVVFTGKHLFELPFTDIKSLKDARTLLQELEGKKSASRKKAA